jgi:hypothetical protein
LTAVKNDIGHPSEQISEAVNALGAVAEGHARRGLRNARYEIQWIGRPRAGGAEIIDRIPDRAPDDNAIKQHARHLFATIYKPGAYAIRIIDSAGREVHLWVPKDDDDPRA